MNNICPVCGTSTNQYIKVNLFNRCYVNLGQKDQQLVYNRCPNCDVIYCQTMFNWSKQDFANKIYNQNYSKLDNCWIDTSNHRIIECKDILESRYPDFKTKKLLDYGCGGGFVTNKMNQLGWNMDNYDMFNPLFNKFPKKKYDLIISWQVFQHCFNFIETIENLLKLSKKDFTWIIGTHFHAKDIDKSWWYFGPRCGHIIFYSQKTFQYIAQKYNLIFTNISDSVHQLKSK